MEFRTNGVRHANMLPCNFPSFSSEVSSNYLLIINSISFGLVLPLGIKTVLYFGGNRAITLRNPLETWHKDEEKCMKRHQELEKTCVVGAQNMGVQRARTHRAP